MDERKACWVRFQGWAYWEDELEIRRVAWLYRYGCGALRMEKDGWFMEEEHEKVMTVGTACPFCNGMVGATERLGPSAAVEMMKWAAGQSDQEKAHWYADLVLRERLLGGGERTLVEAWDKVGKWYS